MNEAKNSTNQDGDFTIAAAEQGDCSLCFSENKFDAACVGHLRGDFGHGGKEFWTTWWPHHHGDLQKEDFADDLDNTINGLREKGILTNFSDMRSYCRKIENAKIQSQSGDEYAFRIDTKDYRYYLRCIPRTGDCNFYCYMYDRAALLELQRLDHGLPKRCWSVLPSTGELISIVYGEKGYHPQKVSDTCSMTAKEMADILNENTGVTKAQRRAMEMGSLFGWSVPGAYPKVYEKPTRGTERKVAER